MFTRHLICFTKLGTVPMGTPKFQWVRTSYSSVELPLFWVNSLFFDKPSWVYLGDCILFAWAAAANCHHLRQAQNLILLYHSIEMLLKRTRGDRGTVVSTIVKHTFWANSHVGPTIALWFLPHPAVDRSWYIHPAFNGSLDINQLSFRFGPAFFEQRSFSPERRLSAIGY